MNHSPLATRHLGNIRVHWLDGGAFRPDGGAMFGPVPKRAWSRRYPCDENNLVLMATRPLLIETPAGLVVVDGGLGHHLTEAQQRIYSVAGVTSVEASLRALGLSPADIAWVVVTHLHLDHASGLVRPGADGRLGPLFPRARHLVQQREAEDIANPHERVRHAYDHPSWQLLVDGGLVELVDDTREIAPGVQVFLTGGHSRGHQGLLVSDEGDSLVHLADVMPTAAHLRPLWVSALDDFPMETIEVKRRWLGQAIANGWWLTFYHDRRVLAGKCTAEYELVDEQVAEGAAANK